MPSKPVRLAHRILPRSVAGVLSRWLNLPSRIAALEYGQRKLAERALDRDHGGRIEPGDLSTHELRVTSQNGEDGILLYLFSELGTESRYAVEFGCGDGSEFNSRNLLCQWGWGGLLLEGDPAKAERARRQLGSRRRTAGPTEVVKALLTRENVDSILAKESAVSEPDLLSIDVDGIDYWLWRSIVSLRPRVVVIEYNAAFGPDRSITVPYDPSFDAHAHHSSGTYHGASLRALSRLGKEKGYALVGCESQGVNAFFVRRDLAAGLPTPTVREAYRPLSGRFTRLDSEARFAAVGHLAYVEV